MNEHECVFVEEQEPSGRLVLPPCIVCGITAMDALAEVKRERDQAKSDMGQAYAFKCDDLRRETERTTQLAAAVAVLTKERDSERAANQEWETRCGRHIREREELGDLLGELAYEGRIKGYGDPTEEIHDPTGTLGRVRVALTKDEA